LRKKDFRNANPIFTKQPQCIFKSKRTTKANLKANARGELASEFKTFPPSHSPQESFLFKSKAVEAVI
jgi:hypothetical protein